jgi:hypothetical protein
MRTENLFEPNPSLVKSINTIASNLKWKKYNLCLVKKVQLEQLKNKHCLLKD